MHIDVSALLNAWIKYGMQQGKLEEKLHTISTAHI